MVDYEVPVTEARVVNVHWQSHTDSHAPGQTDEDVGDGVAAIGVADGSEDGMEPVQTDANHVVD